jgi:hypothetical protein
MAVKNSRLAGNRRLGGDGVPTSLVIASLPTPERTCHENHTRHHVHRHRAICASGEARPCADVQRLCRRHLLHGHIHDNFGSSFAKAFDAAGGNDNDTPLLLRMMQKPAAPAVRECIYDKRKNGDTVQRCAVQ